MKIASHKTFFLLYFLLFAFISIPLFSLTIDFDGTRFEKNGILWQPVKFKDGDSQFQSLFPGDTLSGIVTPWCHVFSKYGLSQYTIFTHMHARYAIPKSEQAFLKILTANLSDSEVLTALEISDKNVAYAAEISTYEKETATLVKMKRFYFMKDQKVYYAVVEGQDFTLAADFFNSIKFSVE